MEYNSTSGMIFWFNLQPVAPLGSRVILLTEPPGWGRERSRVVTAAAKFKPIMGTRPAAGEASEVSVSVTRPSLIPGEICGFFYILPHDQTVSVTHNYT